MNLLERLLRFFGVKRRTSSLFDRTFVPVDHPLRPELDARYLDMRAAMASGKRESIEDILFREFLSVDVQGKEISADAMIDSVLKLDIDRSKRSVGTTIVSIEESDGIARVLQHYSMETSASVAPTMPKRLRTLSADVWVKDGDQWKLSKTTTLELEVIAGNGIRRHVAAKQAP